MINVNKIDFQGIGDVLATFASDLDSSANGKLVKVSGSKTVAIAGDGEVFHAKALKVEKDGAVGIQLKGYIEVDYTGTTAPTIGCCKLVSNGTGGAKADSANGREYLVITLDTSVKKVGFLI